MLIGEEIVLFFVLTPFTEKFFRYIMNNANICSHINIKGVIYG